MSEHKTVVWFGDDPQPNTFFFRSPFRSWKFVFNTVLLAVVCLATVFMLWDYSTGFRSFPIFLLTLLLLVVVYPYWHALKRRAKIHEHFLTGKIAESAPETPLNDLLDVADDSINEGLRNSTFAFGLFLFALYLSRWVHPK